MTEFESDQKSDEKARDAARSLARVLLAPARFLSKGLRSETEFTLADMIRMGAVFLNGINDGYRNQLLRENNRELINKVLESIDSPEALEEFLYERIKQRNATESEIDKAITEAEEFVGRPGGIGRIIKQALKDILPKSTRGRPTKFNPATDSVRFLSVSAEIEGTCKTFLELKDKFPGKGTKALLDFIETEHPEPIAFIKEQSGSISRIVRDLNFEAVKSETTKARHLADAVTGKSLFGWAATYSVQKGQEFRRAKARASEE